MKVVSKAMHDPSTPPALKETPMDPHAGMMTCMEEMMKQCREMMDMMAEGQDVSRETMKALIEKVVDRQISVEVKHPLQNKSPILDIEFIREDGEIRRAKVKET